MNIILLPSQQIRRERKTTAKSGDAISAAALSAATTADTVERSDFSDDEGKDEEEEEEEDDDDEEESEHYSEWEGEDVVPNLGDDSYYRRMDTAATEVLSREMSHDGAETSTLLDVGVIWPRPQGAKQGLVRSESSINEVASIKF